MPTLNNFLLPVATYRLLTLPRLLFPVEGKKRSSQLIMRPSLSGIGLLVASAAAGALGSPSGAQTLTMFTGE